MAAAWAAFLAAGVLEALMFALVDPRDLRWFGVAPLAISPQAVYTLAFLLLWAVIAWAAGLALWLAQAPLQDPRVPRPAPGGPR